ncbi:MAG TPA: cupin domain-containing protein [Candidatus Saccharimonadales bacterium]|nr:cupin domain-containing protein [Candidatus Saccharimonadales bacterium]
MEQRAGGLKPAGDGWFVVNAREAEWIHNEKFGAGVTFEGTPEFAQLGININVVWPGQPNGYYHAEQDQENFLILSGECLLLIEGEERRLRAWDFVHCAPGTEHIFVGAGSGPCAFLAVGARNTPDGIVYPVSDLALRHGAGVTESTTKSDEAYAGTPTTSAGPYAGGLPAFQ